MNVKCFKYRSIQHLENWSRHGGWEIKRVLLITKRLRMIKIRLISNGVNFSSVRNTGRS